eukprot:236105-Lingulodinium_polyedra.AAC.1
MAVVVMMGNVEKIARRNRQFVGNNRKLVGGFVGKCVGDCRGLSGDCRGLSDMVAKHGATHIETTSLERAPKHAPSCVQNICTCVCPSGCLCPCACARACPCVCVCL